jgi:hypothetical protein
MNDAGCIVPFRQLPGILTFLRGGQHTPQRTPATAACKRGPPQHKTNPEYGITSNKDVKKLLFFQGLYGTMFLKSLYAPSFEVIDTRSVNYPTRHL